ncbi:unnamed protein product [Pocillopora meandrina]|uniref:LAGLIDADG endonuclease n=1 Tax=Pocillopora meandrina TaxID=46732 RepID=A0AAU9W4Y0_9CNID|nr:unnamed protein product [Pocillopora meandrina]
MQSHCDTKDFLCLYLSGDGTPIRIFTPINHGNKLSGIRELAFIWIEACIVQSGKNLEGNSIMIDWFAFQGCNQEYLMPKLFSVFPRLDHTAIGRFIDTQNSRDFATWYFKPSSGRKRLHELF